MVIVGQPRLSAACKEKALGKLIVRHRNPPTTTIHPAGTLLSQQHLSVSTVVQKEEGARLTLSILLEGERSSDVCICMCHVYDICDICMIYVFVDLHEMFDVCVLYVYV